MQSISFYARQYPNNKDDYGEQAERYFGVCALTLPMNKFRGFSNYARTIVPRWRPMGLPGPISNFTGLDFTRKPNFRNPISKLLKNFGEQTFESILLLTVYRSPMLEVLYNG